MNARDPRILDLLNEVLTAELTAINQYFLHARLCGHWGFCKLEGIIRKESIDEMKHADEVIARVLYLDGLPNLQRLFKLNVGENVQECLEADLALEVTAIDRLNKGIALCVEVGDNGTRELLEGILVGEEEHADWIETQLGAIKQVGLPNYLAQQL